MKRVLRFLFFLPLLAFTSITLHAQTYDDAEKTALYNILIQNSATEGVKNYEKLGLTNTDLDNWQTDEAWVQKLIDNNILVWNTESPKKLVTLDMAMKEIAGELDFSAFSKLNILNIGSDAGKYNRVTKIIAPVKADGDKDMAMFFCGGNLLTSLDVSDLNIASFICADNQITDFKFNPNATTTYYFMANYNYITFAQLPDLSGVGTVVINPQRDFDGGNIAVTDQIDLSTFGATAYEWKDGKGDPVTMESENNGVFVAGSANSNKSLICTMTNSSFSGAALTYKVTVGNVDTYDPQSKAALRNFLMQESAVDGIYNYEQLSLTDDDIIGWEVGEEWIAKLIGGENPVSVWYSPSGLPKLVELYIQDKNLAGSLDLTNTGVWKFNANNNKLTSLIMPTISYIYSFSIDNNELTTLDISGINIIESMLSVNNNKLTEFKYNALPANLYITGNYLKFSDLPLPASISSNYYYTPQSVIDGGKVAHDVVIDLSSEYSINGNTTTYSWRDGSGAITMTDEGNGKFSAGEANKGKILYCDMTNASFPGFTSASPLVYKVEIEDTSTGVEENKEEANIGIYPNPVTSALFVNKTADSIELFDLAGKSIAKSLNSNSIDVESINNGIYVVKIIADNNTHIYKIVKK